MHTGRLAWAEIDLSAMRRNMLGVKSLLRAGTRFCAVVKADGYGHGAAYAAGEAVRAGADYLAVAMLDEALELRLAGFTQPLLILGHTPPEQYGLVAAHAVTQTIFNREQALALSAAAAEQGHEVKAHIKVDTGMGRLGVHPGDAADLAAFAANLPGLALEGVFTHFACADRSDKTHAQGQFAIFMEALAAIAARGVRIPIRHCANSAATLNLPHTHLDMVRAGIILYGLSPSAETELPFAPAPVMRFKTRIVQLKTLPAGSCVSYGCTHVTASEARMATLPVGYADGWARGLSNRVSVLVNGRRAPQAGSICMDQCMVDVSGCENAAEGDEVLLFGGPELPAEETAAILGGIAYELVCGVSRRVPRIYV